MKVAILGATGMLGSKTAEVFRAKGHELLTPPHKEADLARPHSLEAYFKAHAFDVLVNCAAFTRVDACEEPAKFSMALNVNGTSAGWLAKFCKSAGRILVHYSSDYVFDGKKGSPYLETDDPSPMNVYGKTKWQGEKLLQAENPSHYLIRTSWLFGPNGQNFVNTMADLLISKPRVEVVSDQLGGPSYTGDIAQFTLELLEKRAESGLYHFCNGGYASWYEFAKEIQKQTGFASCEVAPVSSENVFRPAHRPADSRLDTAKAVRALGRPIRPWREALEDFINKEFQNAPV